MEHVLREQSAHLSVMSSQEEEESCPFASVSPSVNWPQAPGCRLRYSICYARQTGLQEIVFEGGRASVGQKQAPGKLLSASCPARRGIRRGRETK